MRWIIDRADAHRQLSQLLFKIINRLLKQQNNLSKNKCKINF